GGPPRPRGTPLNPASAELASASVVAIAGRFQADRHHLEQVLAAHRLAVRDGQVIDGGKRVVDDTGQHADDQPLVLITVGGEEVDDAAQVPTALTARSFIAFCYR